MDLRIHFSRLALLLLLLFGAWSRASAHDGPPFPIIVDRVTGPWLMSIWADPDVGVGTFFIILEPRAGGALPEDITVEVGVQPVSGRLGEVSYPAVREPERGRIQFKAEPAFDAEELWRVHVRLQSSQGGAEAVTEVAVTPPGFGRWDLLIYLFPFLLIAFLWLRAFARMRKRVRAAR
jgi:hypothetical protein